MHYWEAPTITSLLLVCVLLGLAAFIRLYVPPIRKAGIPAAILAGALGWVLGPSMLDVLPFDTDALERIVYHGLAITFIAIGLQRPAQGTKGGAVKSMAFALPLMAILQGVIGLCFVLAWSSLVEPIHPGFGWSVPLGFSQGPGQALSMGKAWEEGGFTDGAQIGLIVSAVGFLHCIVIGVPLVALGKRMGWVSAAVSENAEDETVHVHHTRPGGLDPLGIQVVAIASVYALTWAILLVGTRFVPAETAHMLWAFHFLIGTGLAIGARMGPLKAAGLESRMLGRVAATAVDLTTAAALTAVRADVVMDWIVPIFAITTIAGLITVAVVVWLGRTGVFPEAPFEHTVVLYGCMSGTLPTGLTLLRMIDPELKSPAARTVVLANPPAVILAAPLLLFVMPLPVRDWPASFPGSSLLALAVAVAWGSIVAAAFWWFRPRPD
jgi:glutamate:Na+ symporter, ESS family